MHPNVETPPPDDLVRVIWTWDGFWQWAQTPLGGTIVGTLIAALILWIIGLVYKKLRGASIWKALPGWIRVAVKWSLSLRVKTTKQLATIDREAYSRRSKELEEERAKEPQPAWRIDQKGLIDDDNMYWLDNGGYPAIDVSLTANPDDMVLDGGVFFHGAFGTSTGKWFKGKVTGKGLAEGVNFLIGWTDGAGDRHSVPYVLPADHHRVKDLETRDEAYARGRADRQAELDEERAVPLSRPRWKASVSKSQPGRFLIENTANGVPAVFVVLDAPSSLFVFGGKPEWDVMTGPRAALFDGEITYHGAAYGVTLTVGWTDENGDRWSDEIPLLGVAAPY